MDENIIRLELPLKHPKTIRVTFIPDLPGPLTRVRVHAELFSIIVSR
ncbi:hypothetical protein AZE42_10374 [Rhizopogon vesiculosus]|uniref:Uncharacterized protein n=1 Tax=Rhizopogon vesiculosus TaxID=180088 RepID=A0A1J8Q6V7_9AGAM|nr:hypothetical protein AZE42_10374 [Rhizopogon vesiculosus]